MCLLLMIGKVRSRYQGRVVFVRGTSRIARLICRGEGGERWKRRQEVGKERRREAGSNHE